MKRFIAMAVAVLLLTVPALCQSPLAGIWQNNSFGYEMTLMLNRDGTGEFDGDELTYTNTDHQLTLRIEGTSMVYEYVLNGSTLTLSGGDMDRPVAFTRYNSSQPQQVTTSQPALPPAAVAPGGNTTLIGVWSGQGEQIEFRKNGQCIYLGNPYTYSLNGNELILQTSQGNAMLTYKMTGDQLTLSANGRSIIYTRGPADSSGPAPGSGRVAPELVGKWCYVNVTSTNSGGYSSDRCITLNADGTYLYYGETSSSVNTNSFSGGTSSQSGDRGTWSYDGLRIYYQSSQTGQSGSFALQKQNHPKNNDPMIVLDGTAYVTFYQKAPW